MVSLARNYGRGPQPLAVLAREEDLPSAFIEHLAADLRRAGLIVSHRGAHGGYELGRAPEQITTGEIMRVLEGPVAPMLCASEVPGDVYCVREEICTTKTLWTRVRDAIVRTLDATTLADLLPASPAGGPQPVHFLEDARQLHAMLPSDCGVPARRTPQAGKA
jgi:Rrf2 family protein